MKNYNKPILALLIGAMTVMSAAGFAEARMGMHGGGHAMPYYGGAMGEGITPEMRQMMEKAYNQMAPLQLELRAKQQELTAKIYGGADDKSVQQVADEVTTLQKRLTEARVKMQQDFAKAGIPMHGGGCMFGNGPMGGPGKMGHGMGGHGMMGHGMGGHGMMGQGNGPAMGGQNTDNIN